MLVPTLTRLGTVFSDILHPMEPQSTYHASTEIARSSPEGAPNAGSFAVRFATSSGLNSVEDAGDKEAASGNLTNLVRLMGDLARVELTLRGFLR